jgi:hypothetical protein
MLILLSKTKTLNRCDAVVLSQSHMFRVNYGFNLVKLFLINLIVVCTDYVTVYVTNCWSNAVCH